MGPLIFIALLMVVVFAGDWARALVAPQRMEAPAAQAGA